MKIFKKCTLFLIIFSSASFLASCASTTANKKSHTEFCSEKFAIAQDMYKKGKYGRTTEKLEEILSLCAGTGFMEQSQFLLAESYFNLEAWIEARGEYSSFVMNFPGSPFLETAEYHKAVSSYNIEYKISRDESYTLTAMKDFKTYLDDFPKTALRDSVDFYMSELLERTAEKDFQTAKLYMRMDKPQATIIYLKEFLETYKNSKRVQEALFMISQAYTDLEQFDEARAYLDIARQQMKADDKDLQKLLDKTEKKIAKAEIQFEKKLKKDSEKKRVQKEESEMLN